MSRLSDKMGEIQRELSIMNTSELYDLLVQFDENALSTYFIKDFLVYLNDNKTECLTITLLDVGVSIQHIKENPNIGNPIFIVKNLEFNETVSLVKTILRNYKIKKLQNG